MCIPVIRTLYIVKRKKNEKNCKKALTKGVRYGIISKRSREEPKRSGETRREGKKNLKKHLTKGTECGKIVKRFKRGEREERRASKKVRKKSKKALDKLGKIW